MRTVLPFFLTTTLMALPAIAQEVGEVTLTIDGKTQAFALSSDQSDFAGSPQMVSVSMVFSGPREGNVTEFSKVSLGFELGADGLRGAEGSLQGKIDGEWTTFACHGEEEKGDLSFDIEETGVDGELLTVKGAFACQMGTTKNYGADIDMSEPIEVSGTFSVALERL